MREKSITSKQLKSHFPQIQAETTKGTAFVVFYRSKPLAKLLPRFFPSKKGGKFQAAKKTPHLPRVTFANLRQHTFHTTDRKPFSAVDMIRKERDDE